MCDCIDDVLGAEADVWMAIEHVGPPIGCQNDLAAIGIACTPHRAMVGAGASVRKTLFKTCPFAPRLGLSVS